MKATRAELPQLMEPLHAVAFLAIAVLSLWLYRYTNDRLNGKPPPSGSPFEYPAIEACSQELSQIKPTPYRPFKWGAYQ